MAYYDVQQGLVNTGQIISIRHIPSGIDISFKAFLTEFEDKFSTEFKEDMVYGRTDPYQTFQGTKRAIAMGWQTVAASLEEAKSNLHKTSLLFHFQYPAYSAEAGALTVAAPPFMQFKFMNLVTDASTGQNSTGAQSGLIGAMANISAKPDIEAGFYEEPGKIYPKVMSITCEFRVVHVHPVGWNADTKKPFVKQYPYGVESQPLGSGDTYAFFDPENLTPNSPPRLAEVAAAVAAAPLTGRGNTGQIIIPDDPALTDNAKSNT